MTLHNLLRIGKLREHAPNAAEIQRLLAAIDRSLQDSKSTSISHELRYDAGYKAIMLCSLVAMMAAGYRPSNSEPGHHQTMIQSLPLTLGVSNEVWVVLDAMRRMRNAIDYTGHPIAKTAANECIEHAQALRRQLQTHLESRFPELIAAPCTGSSNAGALRGT